MAWRERKGADGASRAGWGHTVDLRFLEAIRLAELEGVLELLEREKPAPGTVLEIGAGAGWQARKLAESGYSVEAIDVDASGYAGDRVWPITDYDGSHIPFPHGRFDVVFSSNVMEHIPHFAAFQGEIRRVLRPDGLVIHLVPSAAWRLWTDLAHYPFLLKATWALIRRKVRKPRLAGEGDPESGTLPAGRNRPSTADRIRRALFPSRHGEVGNALTELYYFSRRRCSRLFAATGWRVTRVRANGIFYTGYMLLGGHVSIPARRALSHLLGSACHVFVLTKGDAATPPAPADDEGAAPGNGTIACRPPSARLGPTAPARAELLVQAHQAGDVGARVELALGNLPAAAAHRRPERGVARPAARASPRAPRPTPGGTRKPFTPSRTTSGMPPTRLATTGRPAAIASSTAIGSPSP